MFSLPPLISHNKTKTYQFHGICDDGFVRVCVPSSPRV